MNNLYKPVDSLKSPRFCGIKTFMRVPFIRETEGVDVAIVGIPFDTASTYRTGSRFGPAAIRDMSVTVRPYNINMEINSFDYISVIDYGDFDIIPGYIEESYKIIEEELTKLMNSDVIPICLGGDHSITLGELRAAAKKHGPLALVHFDSHTDTVDSYFGKPYNHGTPFYHAIKEGLIDTEHSIQVGMRGNLYTPNALKDSEDLGLQVITAREMHQIGMDETSKRILARADGRKAFLTFDIDFVDPAYAPGTGTIEIGGFTSYETMELIRGIKDLNAVAFDLVEVAPSYDPTQITANLAANIVHDFIAMVALKK
ncbi:MAG: agmatinase, partial [Peptostreptococcaceae bacterium]|nr:agmatinase [Peptostreptococcaceae bacterium]